jgi:DNA-directed RNA polymerase II subunit RPB2
MPFGQNAVVAILSYNGYNQEDSIIINQSAIDRGMFRGETLKKYEVEIQKNATTSRYDIFTKPDRNKVTGMKQANYEKLNDKGYVPEETHIKDGDVIIGKIKPITPGGDNKVFADDSTIYRNAYDGIVDRVHTDVYNSDGIKMYNMRIRMERIPIVGDKFTNYHGNKGTCGIILSQSDMPFTESGMTPDVIINPLGIPSRMYMGMIMESMVSKEGAQNGHYTDGTPFNDYDIHQIPDLLKKAGFHPSGTEIMYCGITGKKMEAQIFIAPSYTLKLKHKVLDKIFSKAVGVKSQLTRQSVGGRATSGGLKIGIMESDAIVSHGMSQFSKERILYM